MPARGSAAATSLPRWHLTRIYLDRKRYAANLTGGGLVEGLVLAPGQATCDLEPYLSIETFHGNGWANAPSHSRDAGPLLECLWSRADGPLQCRIIEPGQVTGASRRRKLKYSRRPAPSCLL